MDKILARAAFLALLAAFPAASRAAGGYYVGGKVFIPGGGPIFGGSSVRCWTGPGADPHGRTGETIRDWVVTFKRLHKQERLLSDLEKGPPAEGVFPAAFASLQANAARSKIRTLSWRLADLGKNLEELRPGQLAKLEEYFGQVPQSGTFEGFITESWNAPAEDYAIVARERCANDDDL